MKDILQPLIDEFMPFAQKRMGFEKPPRVFLRDDPQNAQDPLGKTAHYDPEQMSVTLYINGRHPKDIMRSLSHELVHHMQNCNGQFDNTGDMGEGYAQNDPHLREMEREAYEKGNLCLRDWTDTRNSTIYNVSLQEGAKKKMSLKDWKNNELRTVLSERWGFSFNLLTESQEEEPVDEAKIPVIRRSDTPDFHIRRELRDNPEATREELVSAVMENTLMSRDKAEEAVDKHLSGERDIAEGGAALRVGNEDRLEQRHAHSDRIHEEEGQAFAPNHYCVHHGGVERNGSVEMAEAVNHNFDKKLGRVTHYDMKFADGTIMENVAFEDIQVTNASLAEMHGSHPAKSDHKDKRDEELDEAKGEKGDADPLGGERAKFDKDHDGVPDGADKDPDDPKVGSKKKKNEAQIRSLVRRLVKEAMTKKAK